MLPGALTLGNFDAFPYNNGTWQKLQEQEVQL